MGKIDTAAGVGTDAASAADPLIVIDRLTKHYGAMAALGGVSLSIRRGEFLSLLGPSGCGKTTLLRSIAGFVEPTSGEIRIDGRLMNQVPPNHRPVNMVFQNYALFPHMTVADNVAFGPRRRKMAKGEVAEMVREVLDMVGMDGFGDRYPRSLSGGQQQRVALARALVNRPQVLLLDEPLAALDLKLRKRMRTELKRLHDLLGITFIYVTHDQEEALAMSDRIAVMKDGLIVQFADGQEIYRNPASRYVADFIGEANLIDCLCDADGRLSIAGAALPYGGGKVGAVTLMVRPEDIRIGVGGDDAVTVTVALRDKIFLGQSWRLSAVLGSGQEITIQPGAVSAAEQLVPGQEIAVWWPRDRGRILTQ